MRVLPVKDRWTAVPFSAGCSGMFGGVYTVFSLALVWRTARSYSAHHPSRVSVDAGKPLGDVIFPSGYCLHNAHWY